MLQTNGNNMLRAWQRRHCKHQPNVVTSPSSADVNSTLRSLELAQAMAMDSPIAPSQVSVAKHRNMQVQLDEERARRGRMDEVHAELKGQNAAFQELLQESRTTRHATKTAGGAETYQRRDANIS